MEEKALVLGIEIKEDSKYSIYSCMEECKKA